MYAYLIKAIIRDIEFNLQNADSMDAAKKYIKSIRTDPIRQTAYGPNGYSIHLLQKEAEQNG